MSFRRCSLILPLLLLSASMPAAPLAGDDPAESITADELHQHILWLASDDLEGRYPGSKGYETAARYGASQFEAAGLSPIATDGKGKPTFLQPVPIVRRTIGDEIAMILNTPAGKKEYAHRTDFTWSRGEIYHDPSEPRGVVFAGYGIEQPEHGWNDLDGLEIEGKILILLMGAPVRGGAPVLPGDIHGEYQSIGGIFLKIHELRKREPAALIFVADEEILGTWDRIPPATARKPVMYPGSRATIPDPAVMVIKPEAAGGIFSGQDYDPLAGGGENLDQFRTFELEGVAMSLEAKIDDEPVPTWNVVGLIEGIDPELESQPIVVAGHLDHKEPVDGQIMNGASDNASGSAAVMEIAEAVAMDPPRRPVIFILLAAEECGMHGSRHFLSSGLVPADNIILCINLDEIGRAGPLSPGSRGHGVLNPFTINPELADIVREVDARTVDWPLNHVAEVADVSDDMWFRVKRIPSVLFFSGKDALHHKPTDDTETVDIGQVQGLSRLAYHLIMELGDREESIRP